MTKEQEARQTAAAKRAADSDPGGVGLNPDEVQRLEDERAKAREAEAQRLEDETRDVQRVMESAPAFDPENPANPAKADRQTDGSRRGKK